jgi:uncharacterized membrane protein
MKNTSSKLFFSVKKWLKQWSFVGIFLGLLFFIISIHPSLMPRPFFMQGAISGVSFFIGYIVGISLRSLWLYLELPCPKPASYLLLKKILSGYLVLLLILTLRSSYTAQLILHSNLELAFSSSYYLFKLIKSLLVAIVVVSLLYYLSHFFLLGFKKISNFFHQHIPRRVSRVLGGIFFVLILFFAINNTLVSGVITLLNSLNAAVDVTTPNNTEPPTEAEKSGSYSSLVDWNDLGRQGKLFISRGSSRDTISDFNQREAKEPIRVYVGLRSASDFEEQAKLALEELKRTDAFSRKLLVITTPTGTGWIDSGSVNPIEFLHDGDTAIVAVQYSYFPSPISLILEPERSQKSARIVFQEIYSYWKTLPVEDRPKLYLNGLSLGSHGSEASAQFYELLGDPINGAVWSGPPFRNTLWRYTIENRNTDSSAWLPRFGDGSFIRVTGRENTLTDQGSSWGPMRIVYIVYPSDAISYFEETMWYRMPEWLDPFNISPAATHMNWFPLVTIWQVAVDMVLVGETTPGHGHNYEPESYINAWVAVSDPENADPTYIERLGKHLKEIMLRERAENSSSVHQ